MVQNIVAVVVNYTSIRNNSTIEIGSLHWEKLTGTKVCIEICVSVRFQHW